MRFKICILEHELTLATTQRSKNDRRSRTLQNQPLNVFFSTNKNQKQKIIQHHHKGPVAVAEARIHEQNLKHSDSWKANILARPSPLLLCCYPMITVIHRTVIVGVIIPVSTKNACSVAAATNNGRRSVPADSYHGNMCMSFPFHNHLTNEQLYSTSWASSFSVRPSLIPSTAEITPLKIPTFRN